MVALAVLAVLPVFVCSLAPATDATTATKSQVLKAQLTQMQAELKQKTAKLNALQGELDKLASRENAIEVRLAAADNGISKAQAAIAQSQKDLGAARATLEERLVSLYKQDSTSASAFAEALMGEGDLADVLDRFEDLSQIADEDQKLFDEVETSLEQQQRSKRDLQQEEAAEQADLQALGRLQADASAEFASADQEYMALKSQTDQLKADIQKADAAAAASAAAARKRAAQRMAQSVGQGWNNSSNGTIQPPPFLFPVKGPHSFVDSWGAPRSGGRTHKGTDIFAARGTPLVACVTGTIHRLSHADVGLGGISISLKGNNGYYYYYCHLDRIESGVYVGMAVQAGTVMGYVGNTGNARREACHLHFGMMPGGGACVNPYPTLRYYDD